MADQTSTTIAIYSPTLRGGELVLDRLVEYAHGSLLGERMWRSSEPTVGTLRQDLYWGTHTVRLLAAPGEHLDRTRVMRFLLQEADLVIYVDYVLRRNATQQQQWRREAFETWSRLAIEGRVDWTHRPWVVMADVREGPIDAALMDGRPTAVPCLPCRPHWGAGIAALWQYLLAQHPILQHTAPFTATITPEETSHELAVAKELDGLQLTTHSGLDCGAYSQALAAAEAGIELQTTTLHPYHEPIVNWYTYAARSAARQQDWEIAEHYYRTLQEYFSTQELPWPRWKARIDAEVAALATGRDVLSAIRTLAAHIGFTLDERARCATVAHSLRHLLLVDGTVPVITSRMHVTPDAYGIAIVVTTPVTVTADLTWPKHLIMTTAAGETVRLDRVPETGVSLWYIYWFMDDILVTPLPGGGTQITALRWRMQRHASGGLVGKSGTGQWSLWTWLWQRRFARAGRVDEEATRFLRDILSTLNPKGCDLAAAFVQGTLTYTPTLVGGDADVTRRA